MGEQQLMYFLTTADFRRTDVIPTPYQFPEEVTRVRFAYFLVDNFRRSLGRKERQLATLEWMAVKTGFDYRITLASYRDTGGFENLSGTEQQAIYSQYLTSAEAARRRKREYTGFTASETAPHSLVINTFGQLMDHNLFVISAGSDVRAILGKGAQELIKSDLPLNTILDRLNIDQLKS